MDPTVWLDGARPPPPMFSKKIWVQQTQKLDKLPAVPPNQKSKQSRVTNLSVL
jgi:hypothetical protein